MKASKRIPMNLPSAGNMREHWGARKRRCEAQRATGYSATLSIIRDLTGKICVEFAVAPLTVTFTRIAPRALDGDNLQSAFKAMRDGVADAFGCKDNDPKLIWVYQQRREKPREYAVEIASASSTVEVGPA